MSVIAQKPLLGLLRHTLDAPSLGYKLFLKTREGIFEYGPQQRRHWTPRVEAGLGAEELSWEHAGIGQLLVPRIPAGRHGRHGPCRPRLG